ncbi:MAG: hydroxymethylbilane synthase [Planctomycetia bacterium]|nr:hydroxymethylbilane synthase [Planctomycetia bacterium]
MERTLRLGTRASRLALAQATQVIEALRSIGRDVDLVPLTTLGDRQRDVKLSSLGGVGAFTREIQRSLLANQTDLAVHSLKDLPTSPHEGLTLAATPRRFQRHDVAVSVRFRDWSELPECAVVGTGSQRRSAQLSHQLPSLKIRPIRGNIETRLEKLAAGEYDVLLLSAVSLYRLGLDRTWSVLPSPPWEWLCPAAGQGAIGIEIRQSDVELHRTLQRISDPYTFTEITAERSMLRELGAGCSAPVGASAELTSDLKGAFHLRFHGCLLSEDGRIRTDVRDALPLPTVPVTRPGPPPEEWLTLATTLGTRVATSLRQRFPSPTSGDERFLPFDLNDHK